MRRRRDGLHVWPVFTDLMSGIAVMLLVLGVRTRIQADAERREADARLKRVQAELDEEKQKIGVKQAIVDKIIAKLAGTQIHVKQNKLGNLEISSDLLFATNEYRIPQASMPGAKTIGNVLVGLFEDPKTSSVISMLMVIGHTDQDGTAAENLTLSTKRAVSLVDVWRTEHFKSDTSQAQRCIAAKIVAVGMGKSRPIVLDEMLGGKPGGECENLPTDRTGGCRKNRRIEIRVVPKDQGTREIDGCD